MITFLLGGEADHLPQCMVSCLYSGASLSTLVPVLPNINSCEYVHTGSARPGTTQSTRTAQRQNCAMPDRHLSECQYKWMPYHRERGTHSEQNRQQARQAVTRKDSVDTQ